MESSRRTEPDDIDTIREGLVRDLYRVVAPLAILSIILRGIRNHVAGIERTSAPLYILAGIVVAAWILHRRIPWRVRGALILTGLLLGGAEAVSYLGVAAPGVYFLPTSVVLAWIVLGTRSSYLAAVLAFSTLAVSAWTFVSGRAVSAIGGKDINRIPMFWIQSALVQAMVAILIVLILRRMFQLTRERQRKLEVERDRFSALIEGIQEALFVVRIPDGAILETNARAVEMFRTDRETLLRSPAFDFNPDIPPWTRVEAAEHIQRTLTEGPQQFVWRSRRTDGTLFWSEIAMRRLRFDAEDQVLVTIRDIDERIQDKLELERLNADLEARVARRTAAIDASRQDLQAFAYAVSHDLRAPLRAIDGFARVLSEDHGPKLETDAKSALDRILVGAGRMNRLIDALLDLSRVDRKPIRRISVDVAAIVRELREETIFSSESESPPIDWEIGPLPPVDSDPDLVRQIWANLLSNAVKFSRSGPSPRIEVRAEEHPDGIWYLVRDNGQGFDMAHSKKLFGMFQRMHDASVEGLGIGLATVKRILNRLGGEIEYESAPGQGATFRFRPCPNRWEETSFDLLDRP